MRDVGRGVGRFARTESRGVDFEIYCSVLG